MQRETNQSNQATFTVCPRCNYPHKDAHQVRAGQSGGKAKVKKGFASPAVQAKAQATRAAQREAKAKEKAKEKANAEASASTPTAQPPR